MGSRAQSRNEQFRGFYTMTYTPGVSSTPSWLNQPSINSAHLTRALALALTDPLLVVQERVALYHTVCPMKLREWRGSSCMRLSW